MTEYQLYCFAQSGNAYRAALMLNLIGVDWQPIYVDFFKGGETRTPKYRAEVNEMGEAPVLVHGAKKLTQSGVILTYLADRTGRLKPDGEDERLEALRWIIFDNQKLNGYLGPYRFLKNFARTAGRSGGDGFSQGPHRRQSRGPRQAAGQGAIRPWRSPRPSPTFHCAAIFTTRPRNSASTSRQSIKILALGSIG